MISLLLAWAASIPVRGLGSVDGGDDVFGGEDWDRLDVRVANDAGAVGR